MNVDNECPHCGEWKGESFAMCKTCSEEPVAIEYHRRAHETYKAVLFQLESGFSARKLYVPRSVLENEDDDKKTFTVPRWFAEQEGLD